MDYTLTLNVNDMSAITVLRNIYECFRMLGDALLVIKGVSSADHLLPIKEISHLQIDSKRPIALIDNLRRLRHNMNHYGYNPSIAEANDSVSLANECFYTAYEKIKQDIT